MHWQRYIKQKDVLWPPKTYVLIENKKVYLIIYFLLEKVIRCAQMPVDCLRASKLVTLGYVYNTSTNLIIYNRVHQNRIYVNFRWNPKQLWGFLWITNQYDPQENSMQRLCNQYYDVHEK